MKQKISLILLCCNLFAACHAPTSSSENSESYTANNLGINEEKSLGPFPIASVTQKQIKTFRITYTPNGNATLHIILDGEDTVRKIYPLKVDAITAITQILTAKNPSYDVQFKEFSCTDTLKVRQTSVPLAKNYQP